MSKDKSLQDKILTEIYNFEKKRTRFWIMKYLVVSLLTLSAFLFVLITTLNILNSQQTLDVLEIFQQDFDIISRYWNDALSTVIEETPIDSQIELLLLIVALLVLVIVFIKNFKKIRNRLIILKRKKT